MAGLAIPGSPQELTTDWLTRALRETGSINNATVTSFDRKIIGEGVGFMGELAQVRLHYDRPEEGAPQSLIAKFPSNVPDNREVGDTFRFYEREIRFYEEIADQVELRTPRRYYSAMDTQAGEYVLLLEDLAPARVGDQLAGCSPEQAELAIRELARFHAAWWESPRLAELDWMPYTGDAAIAQSAVDSYEEAWGPFLEQFSSQVPASILEMGERFGKSIPHMIDRFGVPPRTIVHGDYRLDNLFFATPEGGDPLAVVDWQISSRGRGLFDVAYFTTGALQPEERKAKEMDLLRMYHRILTENGVQGYDFHQCLHDYRISTLFCWLYAVITLGRLDIGNERGLALFTANLDRTVAAITDLNAGELLPS